MPKIYVSKEHLEQLQRELADDKTSLSQLRGERVLACEVSACASQNGQYLDQLAVDEGALVQRIARIQQIVLSAEVYDPLVRNVERVCLGSIVHIASRRGRGEKGGKKTTGIWEIVGHGETSITKRRIAYDTPFGAAMLGMEPNGDTRQLDSPLGSGEYEVIDLYPDWASAEKSTAPVKLAAAK